MIRATATAIEMQNNFGKYLITRNVRDFKQSRSWPLRQKGIWQGDRDMPTPNLYWPVYKNLEKEFLQLADYIHISDDQVNVYSMHIADLIVRCAIEIEALSKELYSQLGGNMSPVDENGIPRTLYFDSDCLNLLEKQWHIGKKQVSVAAPNFYFDKSENIVLTPLRNANVHGKCKWKKAYQAIKHDRKNSLNRATILNLLHIMGALYILNLYYRDERIDIGSIYLNDHVFDNRMGSNVFSVTSFNATGLNLSTHMNDSCIRSPIKNDIDSTIYIIKYDDQSFRELHKKYCLDMKVVRERFIQSEEIAKFIATHPSYPYDSANLIQFCIDAGGFPLLQKILKLQNTADQREAKKEAVLNKHTQIYPDLLPLNL